MIYHICSDTVLNINATDDCVSERMNSESVCCVVGARVGAPKRSNRNRIESKINGNNRESATDRLQSATELTPVFTALSFFEKSSLVRQLPVKLLALLCEM